jgi:hypothetical protein
VDRVAACSAHVPSSVDRVAVELDQAVCEVAHTGGESARVSDESAWRPSKLDHVAASLGRTRSGRTLSESEWGDRVFPLEDSPGNSEGVVMGENQEYEQSLLPE